MGHSDSAPEPFRLLLSSFKLTKSGTLAYCESPLSFP